MRLAAAKRAMPPQALMLERLHPLPAAVFKLFTTTNAISGTDCHFTTARQEIKWKCQMVNNCPTRPLSHLHAHTYGITSCMAPSWNMNSYLFCSLGGVSWEKFWAANVLLMEGVNSPGPGGFLLHKHASWTDMEQFVKKKIYSKQRENVAQRKCIYLRLKECSYCLFISLFSSLFVLPPPSADPVAPAVIYLHSVSLSPLFPHHLYLSPCVSSSHACIPAMGYCFSNLADRGQYLCIVFQYPFLMLT